MRPVALLLLLIPLTSVAQTRARRVLLTGTVQTVPSGTRFAIGTKLGIFSVEAKSAKISLTGKAGKFADLRLGSSVTVLGTVAPVAAGTRATISASRVDIAPAPVAGTRRRSGTSKGS